MKDSLPVGDQVFPRIYSIRTDDNFARAGEMEGPSFERHMFEALTGVDWGDQGMEMASERVVQLERALLVRNFGRCRTDDEGLIPYFERTEHLVNPFIGTATGMDAQAFRRILDEYYSLRGWEKATGRPTRKTLERFGLEAEADLLEKDGLLPREERRP